MSAKERNKERKGEEREEGKKPIKISTISQFYNIYAAAPKGNFKASRVQSSLRLLRCPIKR